MEALIWLIIIYGIYKVFKTLNDEQVEERERREQEEAREKLKAQQKKETQAREAARREQMRIKQEQRLLQLAEQRQLAESLDAEKEAKKLEVLEIEREKKRKAEEERLQREREEEERLQREREEQLKREQEQKAQKEKEKLILFQRKKAKLKEWEALKPNLEKCLAFKELTKSLNLLLETCNEINSEGLLGNYFAIDLVPNKYERIQLGKKYNVSNLSSMHLSKTEFLLLPEHADQPECYKIKKTAPRDYVISVQAPKSNHGSRYLRHTYYRSQGFLLSDGFTTFENLQIIDPIEALPPIAALPADLKELNEEVVKGIYEAVRKDIPKRGYGDQDWPTVIQSISKLNNYESTLVELKSARESVRAKTRRETEILNSFAKDAHGGSSEALSVLLYMLNMRDHLQHLIPFGRVATSKQDKLCVCQFHFIPPESSTLVEKLFKNGNTKLLTKKKQKEYIDQTLTSLMIRTAYVIAHEFKDLFDTIVVNANHTWDDPATGKTKNGCIATLHATTEALLDLVPEKVDPELCFRSLRGLKIPQLEKPATVTPSFELDKDDPRVIKGKDVLPALDPAMNLAALDWMDFEYLVKQLIESYFSDKAEAQSFQASRDRGVDAVIYDPHPITGGKTVLQAKRYTNTVDAAAVRDLYGTVTHEGANSGLLITTSKFGSDAREWAKGKPLKLVDGDMLLSLLLEQTGVTYRIDLDEAKALNQDAK